MTPVSKEDLVEDFRIQTIQEAALKVVSRKGIAGATMQEIAAAAGVAKGTIYLYFKNRDDLVRRTAHSTLSRLLDDLEETLARRQPLPDQIRALVETKLRFFDRHRDFFRMYMAFCQGEMGSAQARPAKRDQPLYRRYLERVTALFEDARARGELGEGLDPARLAPFFVEGIHTVIFRRVSEELPLPLDAEVEWVVTVLLKGIVAGGGRA